MIEIKAITADQAREMVRQRNTNVNRAIDLHNACASIKRAALRSKKHSVLFDWTRGDEDAEWLREQLEGLGFRVEVRPHVVFRGETRMGMTVSW